MHRPCLIATLGVLVSFLSGANAHAADGAVVRRVIRIEQAGQNLLRGDAWRPWQKGFQRQGRVWLCDNGNDEQAQRGLSQSVVLNQTQPDPLVAKVSSRCEAVSGSADSNYSLYIDLVYMDGSHLWGQTASFNTGTHNWQQRQVVIFPEKPVRHVSMNLLLRGHSGKAWFRAPELRQLPTPDGAARFDGVPVVLPGAPAEGFQVRDVAADSDFVQIKQQALGLRLERHETAAKLSDGEAGVYLDVKLTDTTGKDRAITLVYSVPVDGKELRWFDTPRRTEPIDARSEWMNASRFTRIGANGRLSRYPLGGVGSERQGVALGIDMARPAFYRIGYNAATGELFLAYDIGLTPEKPTAHVRLCRFTFDARLQFRGALDRYYKLFPDSFKCRTPEQGLWMPFAKISQVEKFEDFGFKFKEGNGETAWDDAHGIITFRYTEPMTWWMRMPRDVPRTLDAATAYAKQLAEKKGNLESKTLVTSGYRDDEGNLVARMLDTPWCNGAVWSMNSMPNIPGTPNHFYVNWNAKLKNQLYGPQRKANLDGEYIDSSEGYVTDELDFARDHFAAAPTPLCFAATSHKPAIFRGLIAQAYAQRIAADIHAMDHLMMANSTPRRLCWLVPLLDVIGTETNWNPNGQWKPMSDTDLLYRRALCKGKPYCFLMNTRFEDFSHDLVEKYMQRALAFGMFPGFFSHNASQGHYFTRPELYNRDRPLFKKYVPLCRRVAEAGWEPVTRATSNDEHVHVERFGEKTFTVFNDSDVPREVTIRFDTPVGSTCHELVGDRQLLITDGGVALALEPEQVAVLVVP